MLGSPCFTVLQVMESWAGPGNEASMYVQMTKYYANHFSNSYSKKCAKMFVCFVLRFALQVIESQVEPGSN